jgi:hypothetical protein
VRVRSHLSATVLLPTRCAVLAGRYIMPAAAVPFKSVGGGGLGATA